MTNQCLWNVNSQKIIQVIAITIEDIEVLQSLMGILPFMNDDSKKLLGKYFIIELNSLYALLAGSNNSKGLKDFDEDYKNLEFKELSKKIRLLEGIINLE